MESLKTKLFKIIAAKQKLGDKLLAILKERRTLFIKEKKHFESCLSARSMSANEIAAYTCCLYKAKRKIVRLHTMIMSLEVSMKFNESILTHLVHILDTPVLETSDTP